MNARYMWLCITSKFEVVMFTLIIITSIVLPVLGLLGYLPSKPYNPRASGEECGWGRMTYDC